MVEFDLEAFHQQMVDAWICPGCGITPPPTPDQTQSPDGEPLEESQRLLCHCDTREANLPDHGTHANPCPHARCGYCGWKGTLDGLLADSYTEHYSNYKWIKVIHYKDNPGLSLEERVEKLNAHHIKETEFLISEVRKLAAKLDKR